MIREQVRISTADGQCPSYVFAPSSSGQLPAIVFYMDAGGIRPAVVAMAERLAAAGYLVLLPDLFYRFGPYGPLVPIEVLSGDVMAVLGPLMATTDNRRAAVDTKAFIAYLDTRADVAGSFGAIGFCMGGGMALSAAASHPDRFGAVASFHGGSLATDAETSPHRLCANLKASVYIASAEQDDLYPPEQAQRFEAALNSAGVTFRAETYAGTAHGWMKPDFPVYHKAAAERGWAQMLAFFNCLRCPRS